MQFSAWHRRLLAGSGRSCFPCPASLFGLNDVNKFFFVFECCFFHFSLFLNLQSLPMRPNYTEKTCLQNPSCSLPKTCRTILQQHMPKALTASSDGAWGERRFQARKSCCSISSSKDASLGDLFCPVTHHHEPAETILRFVGWCSRGCCQNGQPAQWPGRATSKTVLVAGHGPEVLSQVALAAILPAEDNEEVQEAALVGVIGHPLSQEAAVLLQRAS